MINDEKKALLSSRSPSYPWAPMAYMMIVTCFSSYAYSALNAILDEYLRLWLKVPTHLAVTYFALWQVFTNGSTPIGGILGDFVLNSYRTLLWSFVLWTLGSVLVLLTTLPPLLDEAGGHQSTLVLSLACIGILLSALGNGISSAVLTVFVGDQFEGLSSKRLATSFSVYYFFSNVGSMLGEGVGPFLRQDVSYLVCTMTFLVGTVLATQFQWLGKPVFNVKPASGKKQGDSSIVQSLLRDAHAAAHIMPVFLLMPVFWALFFQQNSTWVNQAAEMQLHLGSLLIPPDFMPSLEDVFVLVNILIFERFMYPALQWLGFPLHPLRRMVLGFAAVALSFICAGLIQLLIQSRPAKTVHVLLQLPQIFLMGCGEVLVAISGLHFAYTQSPPRSRATVTAIWGLMQVAGNGIVAIIALFNISSASAQFFGYGAVLFLFTLFLAIASKYYRFRSFES